MSSTMQKLRSILPNSTAPSSSSSPTTTSNQKPTNSLEPEIGFQIAIEFNEHTVNTRVGGGAVGGGGSGGSDYHAMKSIVPELNVHLIAARHLPSLFGFKIVQGYLIKVKLFPGTKRLDSSIQTNSWPKFNENFKFALAPDIKPSLKHTSRRGSKSTVRDFTPQEVFAGQFVVFTVYALLELPSTSFNRFSKTYRSLKDKSSNLMQNIFETTATAANGNTAPTTTATTAAPTLHEKENKNNSNKRKSMDCNNGMPALTISEARRNLGSVTCYLEPKLFQRNSKGIYTTKELWLPIKDITTTNTAYNSLGNNSNNLTNAPKGVVELVLEVNNLPLAIDPTCNNDETTNNSSSSSNNNSHPNTLHLNAPSNGGSERSIKEHHQHQQQQQKPDNNNNNDKNAYHGQSWNRMTSQVKRKMGISNISNKTKSLCPLALKVTTTRMRCSHKAKDELEHTAGSVYVKTTVFERGIYLDSWKSSHFFPSLSTKWTVLRDRNKEGEDENIAKPDDYGTITIPIQSMETLDRILIKTTLATKTKLGKKLVLGTVMIGVDSSAVNANGVEHMQLLRKSRINERVPMWHCYQ